MDGRSLFWLVVLAVLLFYMTTWLDIGPIPEENRTTPGFTLTEVFEEDTEETTEEDEEEIEEEEDLPDLPENITPPEEGIEKDPYLGLKIANFEATGFFRIEKVQNRHFLVTPEGHPFYIIGLNGVTPWYGLYKENSYETKYNSNMTYWGQESVKRIKNWGFNTLEYKTAEDLIRKMKKGEVDPIPYLPVLEIIENNALQRTEEDFPDVFANEFIDYVDNVAQEQVAPLSSDPYLVGYYLINEPDFDLRDNHWRSRWVKKLLQQDPDTPAMLVFINTVIEKYGTIENFNNAYGSSLESFNEITYNVILNAILELREDPIEDLKTYNARLAEKFYEVTTEVIREYDSNHLIFGARFGGGAETEVLESTKSYTDIVSVNKYTKNINTLVNLLGEFNDITDKPVKHSEFSFCELGRNGGIGGGSYPEVANQQERGEYYYRWAWREVNIPYSTGLAWYEYTDPGPETNFGLVDVYDNVYKETTDIVTLANQAVETRFIEIIQGLN